MKCFVLFAVLVFASNESDVESVANSGENITENAVENLLLVKIEEDECVKKKISSKYIGLSYSYSKSKWEVRRYSKIFHKKFYNGSYKDEETAAHASDTLARKLMENGEQNHRLNFPDDNTEVYPEKKKTSSKYIGVSHNAIYGMWRVQRWSKNENKKVHNGYYNDEETAAHASDTLARKLMANGEQNHKLNFPEDNTEVRPEEKTKHSIYIGVSYFCREKEKRWIAARWSKNEKKAFNNGTYKDEEKAAHASDTLARKFMANGERGYKLNFPYDETEVHAEKRAKNSKYFGVSFNEIFKRWVAQRYSKTERKSRNNGYYKDEETAAHASDTLARKLMANGEQNHKLNFPDDETEVHWPARRMNDFQKTENSKYIGVYYHERIRKWYASRWSRKERKVFTNRYHKDEEKAAHVSDTLARKLMANGERGHKMNFPKDNTEEYAEKKSKRSKYFGISYNEKIKRWLAQRWSKKEKKLFNSGWHKDEETAAIASDTLARQFRVNGEQNHKLNFPEGNTEVHQQQRNFKRKRPFDFEYS